MDNNTQRLIESLIQKGHNDNDGTTLIVKNAEQLQYALARRAKYHQWDDYNFSIRCEVHADGPYLLKPSGEQLSVLAECYQTLSDIINAADNGEPYTADELKDFAQKTCNRVYKTLDPNDKKRLGII